MSGPQPIINDRYRTGWDNIFKAKKGPAPKRATKQKPGSKAAKKKRK